ncbi:hypothetical protein GCM10009775_30090 [Microbacterium aoyamense]|uniref:Uncharacterized protein n=1 Tax=Microbacterium aoyamense TaxID=344166 RepID=A0ABN2PXF6_9MICO|nr:hypothetical protein [Microbacterium aoyamense]
MNGEGSLELVRIDREHWLVHDHAYSSSDARRVVACVEETEGGFDVLWIAGGIPLPVRYSRTGDILDDLRRWRRQNITATHTVDAPRRAPRAISDRAAARSYVRR